MKYIDEYRDSSLVKPLVRELKKSLTRPVRLMEVCGTHTMAIFRTGIRTILPEGMEIVSGPGCPVCVTSASHMDAFIAMAEIPGVRVAIFGDLFRVPGSTGSLANAAARGALVEVVYSPMDALELARNNPADTVARGAAAGSRTQYQRTALSRPCVGNYRCGSLSAIRRSGTGLRSSRI